MADLVESLMNATGVVAVARAAGATAGAERAPGESPYLVYYRGSLEAVEIRGLGFEGEVSEPGAWGRLLNGGASLEVEGRRVEVLYRDLEVVESTLGAHWRSKTRGRVVAGWIAAERARCRRPITPDEVGNLEALGARLRELREQAGLSRPALAKRAQLGKWQIELVERGARRTRRSTLDRIAVALVTECPDLGEPDELVDDLAALAGPALAPESDYADRIARRRKRRHRKHQRATEVKEGEMELSPPAGQASSQRPRLRRVRAGNSSRETLPRAYL